MKNMQIATGRLIKYYRKELYKKTRSSIYTQKGIIYNITEDFIDLLKDSGLSTDRVGICSSKTINAIENGKYYNQDNIIVYQGIAMNLGKNYTSSRAYMAFFDDMYIRTTEDIDWMNLKNFKVSLQDLRRVKSKIEHTLYYGELYEIYETLFLYFIDNILPTKEFTEKYEQLYDIFDERVQPFILYLCYQYYLKIEHDIKKRELLIEKLFHYKTNKFFFIVAHVNYYLQKQKLYAMIQFLNQIKETAHYQSNVFIQYLVNDFLALAMINTNHSHAIKPLEKCVKLVTSHPKIFSNKYYVLAYYHLGIYYHYQEKPELAYQYFKKIACNKTTQIPLLLLLTISNAEKAKIEHNEIKAIINCLTNNPYYTKGNNHTTLQYFKMKYQQETITKQHAIFLEDFILHSVLPNQEKKTEGYRVFLQQLRELSLISGRVKPYLEADFKNNE